MTVSKDVFAGIAAGGMTNRKEALGETMPMEKPAAIFSECKYGCAAITEIAYDEKTRVYQRGLNDLREKYRRFTKRKCAPPGNARERIIIDRFSFAFENKEKIQVEIPHYTGPVGRWTAKYASDFELRTPDEDERVFIVFKGVDYYADVDVNGKRAGSHEGFFAPFEFDITRIIKGKNTLEVTVKNDIPTIGNGDMQINGDKLYAATGPGWDDPQDGWHHCPAGGGIFDKVYIEYRNNVFINDIFIRPDIDNGTAEINLEVFCGNEKNSMIEIKAGIYPYNFTDGSTTEIHKSEKAGFGLNYYKYTVGMEGFRAWEPESPHLYICMAGADRDRLEKTFGMRKFHMDEDGGPKGGLFLNNKPVILRGANEMGHLQLCVMRGDYDQLTEDILIARYCNMNYYRITQRPVQEEIYHYFDMLGMMAQSDLPLFGYMRKNKFQEGVKQAGEMERLVRNHPSVIMDTYINEPFSPDKYELGYRHMSRLELELFFNACDAAVHFENPDRVVKRVEGDYDPPTGKGLSDFHCYNMWYTNHAIPLGMLYKGYLPALKKGWKTGCGEYGAEGLDNYEVMRKYYPKEWLPEKDSDYWIPDRIVKSQTNTMHGDWYEEQDNIRDWIEKSQLHQEFATRLMTLAFRRRSDMIVSTAVHLLIDAWPSGWMKTLLDVDRVPKKAYFAFKESLEPLKINLRCDRWTAYEGDEPEIEAWILNDTSKNFSGFAVYATMRNLKSDFKNYCLDVKSIPPCSAISAGIIKVPLPGTHGDGPMYIDACLGSEDECISSERFTIKVYKQPIDSIKVCGIGGDAGRIISKTPGLVEARLENCEAVIISSRTRYEAMVDAIPGKTKKLFIIPEEKEKFYVTDGIRRQYTPVFDSEEKGENSRLKGLSFAAVSKKIQHIFPGDSMSYWYNEEKGYIDHVAEYYIEGEDMEALVFGFEKPAFGKITRGRKRRLAFAGISGTDRFLSLETRGRSGVNPVLDRFIKFLIAGSGQK
ncbi:MAG: glycoside hydrolase family 2 [Clostridia bacterium]|nr:glycoside hydrolase family 2 [Clostridia bacterium]